MIKRIFENYKIIKKIIKHFSFNNEIYEQTDGVAMGAPMDPVL